MQRYTVVIESDHPDAALNIEAAIDHLLCDEWGDHDVNVDLYRGTARSRSINGWFASGDHDL